MAIECMLIFLQRGEEKSFLYIFSLPDSITDLAAVFNDFIANLNIMTSASMPAIIR